MIIHPDYKASNILPKDDNYLGSYEIFTQICSNLKNFTVTNSMMIKKKFCAPNTGLALEAEPKICHIIVSKEMFSFEVIGKKIFN